MEFRVQWAKKKIDFGRLEMNKYKVIIVFGLPKENEAISETQNFSFF